MSGEGVPIGMVRNTNKGFSFTIIEARDEAND